MYRYLIALIQDTRPIYLMFLGLNHTLYYRAQWIRLLDYGIFQDASAYAVFSTLNLLQRLLFIRKTIHSFLVALLMDAYDYGTFHK